MVADLLVVKIVHRQPTKNCLDGLAFVAVEPRRPEEFLEPVTGEVGNLHWCKVGCLTEVSHRPISVSLIGVLDHNGTDDDLGLGFSRPPA